MNSNPARFEELERRLLSVEKQNRRLKQLGAALLVLVTSLIVMGQAPSKKTVEANEFILRDSGGNVRAKLSMDVHVGSAPGYPASPQLVFFDEKGKQRVQMDGDAFSPGLNLYDSQGRRRGSFDVALDTGVLFLSDEHGTTKTRLTEGEASADEIVAHQMEVLDSSGNIRARFFVTAKTTTTMTIPGMNAPVPVTFNPKATLALYDEKAQVSGVLDDDSISFFKSHVSLGGGVLTMGEQNSAVVVSRYSVGLFDEQGFETTLGRSSLVTPRTGETQMRSAASLVMFDKNKNVIWKAP